MSNIPGAAPRRGIAYTSVIVGAIACLMIVLFFITAGTTGGQGLTDASVLAVFLYFAAPVVGAVAVILGIIGAIFSRARILSVIGVVLGAVPVVLVLVQTATGAQLT